MNDNEEIEFDMTRYCQLQIELDPPTWRHRLYWWLRKWIDRIYPK